MSKRVDWVIGKDRENVSERAIELRRLVAERIYIAPFLSVARARKFMEIPRTAWRHRALQKAELFLGHELRGTILEIGAGTGWCSAIVSKKADVNEVFALDYDDVSVDTIMPLAFDTLEAESEKITRAIGSFNATGLDDNSVDAVISIGAIHHSENLDSTFLEAMRVLKPGGIMIASEPCESDAMTNSEQTEKDTAPISEEHANKLYGDGIGEVSESDNSDHSYRLVDFLSAALRSGFDAYPYTFDTDGLPEKAHSSEYWDQHFSDRKCYRNFEKIVMPPYFAENNPNQEPVYDPLLLILRKP